MAKSIDFLIAGAQKSGTSAIDQYLRLHPNVTMAKCKEVHFFDADDYQSSLDQTYRSYHNNFDFSHVDHLRGESTPIYLYWENCCRRIYEYNPNVKLIFILRNPINRAFSQWNMEYKKGNEQRKFKEAIINELNMRVVNGSFQDRVVSYLDRGYYSQQLRKFYVYFEKDQILVLRYEDFRKEQLRTLHSIFDFLGLSKTTFKYSYQDDYVIPYNQEISKSTYNWIKNIFYDEIRRLEKMLSWDCSEWLNYNN